MHSFRRNKNWILAEAQLREELIDFEDLKESEFRAKILNRGLKKLLNMVPADFNIPREKRDEEYKSLKQKEGHDIFQDHEDQEFDFQDVNELKSILESIYVDTPDFAGMEETKHQK